MGTVLCSTTNVAGALLIKSSSALLHHIHTISRTCSLTRFLFDLSLTRARWILHSLLRAIDRHNFVFSTFSFSPRAPFLASSCSSVWIDAATPKIRTLLHFRRRVLNNCVQLFPILDSRVTETETASASEASFFGGNNDEQNSSPHLFLLVHLHFAFFWSHFVQQGIYVDIYVFVCVCVCIM